MQTNENTLSIQLPEKRRSRLLALVIGVFVIIGIIWIAWWFIYGQFWIETNDAYVSGNITPVDVQTAGTIQQVLAENTEFVHAGQILAVIRGDHSRLLMEQAQAHLGAVVREVRQDFAKVSTLQEIVRAKNAECQQLKMDLIRYQQSLPSGAVSIIRIENTQNEITAANAQLKAALAQLKGAQAIVSGTTIYDNPLVLQAAAAFEKTDIRWQRRLVRAPISGYVAERTAYPGITVSVGQALFSVVPLNDLWVVANIKETAMRHVYPGQAVQLTSYLYGSAVHYHGVVQGLLPGAGSAFSTLPPENATGNYIHIVERVPVRIRIPAAELARHPLRPGLSMIAKIHWTASERHSVLHPRTTTPVNGYETHIYNHQLQQARRHAAAIIRANYVADKN